MNLWRLSLHELLRESVEANYANRYDSKSGSLSMPISEKRHTDALYYDEAKTISKIKTYGLSLPQKSRKRAPFPGGKHTGLSINLIKNVFLYVEHPDTP